MYTVDAGDARVVQGLNEIMSVRTCSLLLRDQNITDARLVRDIEIGAHSPLIALASPKEYHHEKMCIYMPASSDLQFTLFRTFEKRMQRAW